MYDVIIVGAGPAGLTAATNTAHRGLKSLIIEKQDVAGGLPTLLYPDKIILDHPGFPVGILGKELSRMLYMQAKNSGAEIKLDDEVLTIKKIKDNNFRITTIHSTYIGKRVILCTGISNVPKKLEVLKNYVGPNIHYRVENPRLFADKKVVIVGGGDHSFDTAIQLNNSTKNITILVKEAYAKAKKSNVKKVKELGIKILYNSTIVDIPVTRLGIFDKIQIKHSVTNEKKIIKTDNIFIAIGFKPIKRFLNTNGFTMHKDGSIKVESNLQTNIKGIFAAGDITGEIRLIATACAEGIVAAIHAFEEIKKPYWLK